MSIQCRSLCGPFPFLMYSRLMQGGVLNEREEADAIRELEVR